MTTIPTLIALLAAGGLAIAGVLWLNQATSIGPHRREAGSSAATCLGGIPRQREASDGS